MFEVLLERIASALGAAAIPYMIIGGQAVLLYGEPRLTKDIDITLGVDLDRLDEIVSLLAGLALKPLVDPETFTRQTLVLPCSDSESGIRCDFIFSFSPFERSAIQRARTLKIGTTDVCFASLEDLIIHKVVAGRPRDLEDVRVLLLKNAQADRNYIHDWLQQFSTALEQEFLRSFDEIVSGLS